MKCPQCGNSMNAYKEIRGIMTEMGITKEYIQEEIQNTIDSYVRSTVSEDIRKFIGDSIKEIVKKEVSTPTWSRPSKVQEVIRECLQDIVMKELSGLQISISVTNKIQGGAEDGEK